MLHSHHTAKGQYNILIEATKIRRLMGRYEHAAIMIRVVSFVTPGPGVDVDLPTLGEHYGETEGEAERKVLDDVTRWLDARDGASAAQE
jgi:hypothetical protein